MNKINILHMISTGAIGGGEQHLLYIADRLDKDRYNHFFACPNEGDFANELRKRNLPVLVLNMKTKFKPSAFFKIKTFIKKNNIKIVHMHGLRVSFFGVMAAKLTKVPLIITTHHVSISGYPVNCFIKKIYHLINKFLANFTDNIIAVSEAVKKDLVTGSNINPDKIITVYNGVEIERFMAISADEQKNLKKAFGIPEGHYVVGTIGRLVYEKNIDLFLEAAKKVSGVMSNTKFLIIGDGPLKDSLENKAKGLNLSNQCIFTGYRKDIPQIISILDIYVLTSLIEGMPVSILEAMAAGKPIVATKVGGIPEIIEDGKTGLLVKSGDSSAIADAILQLLENTTMARRLGDAGRALVEKNFTAEQMVKKVEKIYEDLIN